MVTWSSRVAGSAGLPFPLNVVQRTPIVSEGETVGRQCPGGRAVEGALP